MTGFQHSLFHDVTRRPPGKVRIGTSGYQYPDWVDGFYPPDVPKSRWLEYYARHFDTVELNSSYYGLPRLSTTRRLAEETPDGFLTVVKAYKGMTHKFEGWEAYDEFRKALVPLQQAGKLGGVLFQFPPWFRNDTKRRDYLRRLPELLPGSEIIVEFRSREWLTEETFALLEELGLAYCCVDEPALEELVPPIARLTSPLGYLRFHSRNAEKWHQGGEARYDYDYSDAEMGEWIAKIRPLLAQVKQFIVYFNNCKRSAAAKNAARFRELLEELEE